MRTSDLILGVRVDLADTSTSANPDQQLDPRFEGMVMAGHFEWYRINNGEWKRFNHKALLLDFGKALKPNDVT